MHLKDTRGTPQWRVKICMPRNKLCPQLQSIKAHLGTHSLASIESYQEQQSFSSSWRGADSMHWENYKRLDIT